MKFNVLIAASLALAGSGTALAQPSGSAAGTGLKLPYERGFWGTAGLSLGRTKLHAPCPAGASCDLRDGGWRAHVGGRFNDILGAEVGWVDFGDFPRGGGETTARGIDLKLLAGVPLGENASVFGKAGLAYLRTSVGGTGLATGRQNDWATTYGIGAQVGLTKNWAIRGDIDRYRVQFPGGGKDNIDTYMLGAQYRFQ